MRIINKNSGFTLVEMMVVISLTFFLAVAMVTDYRHGVRQTSLRAGADELITVLRQSQTAASSGVQYNGAAVGDYRVHLNTATDTLYKVCVGSADCADNVIETVSLPAEVFIDSITLLGGTPIPTDKADVLFVSPFGDIVLNGGSNFSNEFTRTLAVVLTNGSQNLTLEIDPISGRVMYE